MLHDPLIQSFRDYRVWRRKLKKAQGKHDKVKEEILLKEKPEFSYNHLVKERYPTFIDAVRDLDDALTLIHLFAIMPVSITRLKPEHVEFCQRLSREFQYYIIRSNALRKVFVSIKGYYFQAQILGQTVTWIVPHKFNQRPAADVDYKIMLTFLEFYEVLLGFVNFKLFHSLGLKYPPKLDEEKDSNADYFRAIIAENISNAAAAAAASSTAPTGEASEAEAAAQKKKIDQLKKRSEQRLAKLNDAVAKFAAARDDAAAAAEERGEDNEEDGDVFGEESEKIRAEHDVFGKLFEGCLFYISREVPREQVELVIRSFGGQVSYDGGPIAEDSAAITHQIIDRGVEPANRRIGREYVQPQYIFDSANARTLLPVELYSATSKLPPHLSPFVDDEAVGYVPEYRKRLDQYIREAGGDVAAAERQVLDDEDAEEEDDAMDVDDEDDLEADYQQGLKAEQSGNFEDADDDDEDEAGSDAEQVDDDEETPAKPARKSSTMPSAKKRQEAKQELADQMVLAEGMMPSKQRRALAHLKKRQRAKDDVLATLSDKRRKVEAGQLQAQGGVLKSGPKPAKKSK